MYWAFGNPYPRTDGSSRAGTNLFANSLVALDAKTGVRRWHFQSVHHDLWDCDNAMAPLLIDLQISGKARKVVVYGSKSGMFYILDRANGDPVQGVEERPVPQDPRQITWPTQPYPQRRPIRARAVPQLRRRHPARAVLSGRARSSRPAWDRPTIIFPGAVGGGNWAYDSFSPATGYVYVGYSLINTAYSNAEGGPGQHRPAVWRVHVGRPGRDGPADQHGRLAQAQPVVAVARYRHPVHGGPPALPGTAGRQPRRDGRQHRRELWSWQCGAGVNTNARSATRWTASSTSLIFAGGGWEPVGPADALRGQPVGVQARRHASPRPRHQPRRPTATRSPPPR